MAGSLRSFTSRNISGKLMDRSFRILEHSGLSPTSAWRKHPSNALWRGSPISCFTTLINICMGAPIGQGYVLTETCVGIAFYEWDDTSVGRVGHALPCSYLVSWEEGGYRTSDKPMPRGEVVVGGNSVTAGYFNNQEKTDEVYKVDEKGMRWFYTGDIGRFHPDGCLEVIDRKKDIVELQHGEYVFLGKGALEKWAEEAGVKYSSFTALCENGEAVRFNNLLPRMQNSKSLNFQQRSSCC